MGAPYLSRHFLAEQAKAVAAVATLPGAAEGGTAHTLLALGSWCEDAQEARLTIADLSVGYQQNEVSGHPAYNQLASFQAPSSVTAVTAADLSGGQVVVLAAAADGSLSRLQLTVPTAPGSQPEQIKLRGEDFDGPQLLPWAEPHQSPVPGLDIQADTRTVVSAAADGSLALTSLSSPDSCPLWSCGGAVTFTAARWAGPHTVVTASLQGRLQQWDVRQGGSASGPVADLAARGLQPLTCLDIHPAQSYSCAAGDAAGALHVWDLRKGTAAAAAGSSNGSSSSSAASAEAAVLSVGQGAAVSAVRFDAVSAAAAAASGAQRLVFGTAAGEVGIVADASSAAGARVRQLYTEPAAGIAALVVGAAGPSSQLLCFTEQEGLVFMANAL